MVETLRSTRITQQNTLFAHIAKLFALSAVRVFIGPWAASARSLAIPISVNSTGQKSLLTPVMWATSKSCHLCVFIGYIDVIYRVVEVGRVWLEEQGCEFRFIIMENYLNFLK